ncbi:MAG TPA: hypothetical protein VEC93_17205 [Anaerolineae bacterium]|nr:hypothetical protein [Anaerolineae bacterium]
MMSVEFILIAGGLLLIAAALSGGGFKIKEFEFPAITGAFRLISGLVGAITLSVGIWISISPQISGLFGQPSTSTQNTSPESSSASQSYGKLTLGVYLSEKGIESQQNESWKVYFDGDYWGVLNVNATFAQDELVIEIQEGPHNWYLAGKSYWLENEQWRDVDCVGQGQVDIRHQDKYYIDTNWPVPSSGQCVANLFRNND